MKKKDNKERKIVSKYNMFKRKFEEKLKKQKENSKDNKRG